MKHINKLFVALCIVLSLCFTIQVAIPKDTFISTVAQAASKVKLSKTEATLAIGKTLSLKVSGTKKKTTWASSNKSVAKVNKKGVVTAVKAGTAKITAKVGNKKLTCKIVVYKPIKGDISGLIMKKWKNYKDRFRDKFRYFDTDGGWYTYYTNDYILVEVGKDGRIYSLSLLTDAKKGIGKYTLFGVYPGMPYLKAKTLLTSKGYLPNYDDDEDEFWVEENDFEEVQFHKKKTDYYMNITTEYGNVDLVQLVCLD